MKPMLAAAADLQNFRFPLLASPKLDGVRCLIIDGVAMSRSLKPIPNRYVQRILGSEKFNGLDGELVIGDPAAKDVYTRTVSGVMTIEGEPDVKFYVFDDFSSTSNFENRLRQAQKRAKTSPRFVFLNHVIINDETTLLKVEQDYLLHGYEGLMIRDPEGPYKQGRSTANEGYLLKLKRFTDSEAEILGFTQLMTNTNEAVRNELGHLERSSKKEGMVGAGTLGALKVRDIHSKVEFEIGTGFDAEQRKCLWLKRSTLIGLLVKYKSQPVGVKDKPRFPVFLGFRDRSDL